MTKDSDGKYKFSFTFNNAYITSNRLFDNDFKSQINNTFEINMLDAPEFNKPYYLYQMCIRDRSRAKYKSGMYRKHTAANGSECGHRHTSHLWELFPGTHINA